MLLEMVEVNKIIKKKHILHNISFSIRKNEIFGIVGSNGAGKSTLLKILATLSSFEGEITVVRSNLTPNSMNLKCQIGFHIENTPVYEYLTGYEYLSLIAKYKGIKKEDTFLDSEWPLDMDICKHKKVKTYSQGMKQKLGILASTLKNYKLILLDEPHNSLDPTSIIALRNYILSLRDNGSTVVLSSHSISEVTKLCDTVLILDNGKVKDIINKEKLGLLEDYLIKEAR